jgi:glyoxylase-like metal-dependent hydrolase (beta-lactamase superfamily II)
MDNKTERLAEGVWRVEVGPMINAYVLEGTGGAEAGGLTLVDCGTRTAGPRLVRSIRMLGFEPTAVRHVVLTHWHADHMGSAARFATSSAAPAVSAGREDVAAVCGDNPRPHATAPAGEVSRLGRLLSGMARPGPAVADVQPLDDGAVLPEANNARVIASPGHTAGSISLLTIGGVLIAGDAVFNVGRLTRGIGPFRSARSSEAATLRRLAATDFDILAVGHGPPVVKDARRRLARLADRVAR